MLKNLLTSKTSKLIKAPIMWLFITSVILVAFGCSRMTSEDVKKNESNPDTATVTLNKPTKPAATMVLTDMPFEQLVSATSGLLDDYWRQSFKDMQWQATYNSPKGLIPYSKPVQTGCGLLPMENAFFCSADNTIYYDENLVRGLYQEPGDYAAVTVLAHEWGHSVQKDLGIIGGDKQYFTIQTELQADCFAGAFAKHILELGYLEEGDLEEGGEALLKYGDPRNGKWFDPQAHGKPFQRGAYFNKGWEGGIQPCMGQ